MNFNNYIDVAPPGKIDETGRTGASYYSTKPCFIERRQKEVVDYEGNTTLSSATIYFPPYIRGLTLKHKIRFKDTKTTHEILSIQPQNDFKNRLQYTKVYIK